MSLVNPSQQEATTLGTHVPASSDTTQAGHHALNVMSESETNHVTRSADEPTAVDESAKSGDTNKIPCGVWQQPKYSEHPEGDAIRRQVEYYFSDENLPSDEHLLMKTGGSENLPVSLKHICGFKKMRGYKPYRSVVESLKKSEFLDIVDNKYIKRKAPLAITPTVAPQSEENYAKEKQRKPVKDATAPHLTKGMVSRSKYPYSVHANLFISSNLLVSKSILRIPQSPQQCLPRSKSSMTGTSPSPPESKLPSVVTSADVSFTRVPPSYSTRS